MAGTVTNTVTATKRSARKRSRDDGASRAAKKKVSKVKREVVDLTNEAERAKKPNAEKRLRRFKARPTAKDNERLQRAMPGSGHRLYLIGREDVDPVGSPGGASAKFTILGATGNVYTVTVAKDLACNCPDFIKGNVCKHIFFVMLRVLRLDASNPIVWQRALLSAEADEALCAACAADASVQAPQRVRDAYASATNAHRGSACAESKHAEQEGGECPICFDDLASERTTECRVCHKRMHAACVERWLQQQLRVPHADPSCVLCRSPWHDDADANSDGEYLNIPHGIPAPSSRLYSEETLYWIQRNRRWCGR